MTSTPTATVPVLGVLFRPVADGPFPARRRTPYVVLVAGVAGYVLKGDAFAELLSAIAAVMGGNNYISPQRAELTSPCSRRACPPRPRGSWAGRPHARPVYIRRPPRITAARAA